MAENKGVTLCAVKTAGLAVLLSLIAILIFAGIVYVSSISQSTIKVVNQFIKVVVVALAGLIKINGKSGLIKGAISGFIYCILLHLIFFLIGEGSFDGSFWLDIVFTSVVGAIVGVIAVNLKDK